MIKKVIRKWLGIEKIEEDLHECQIKIGGHRIFHQKFMKNVDDANIDFLFSCISPVDIDRFIELEKYTPLNKLSIAIIKMIGNRYKTNIDFDGILFHCGDFICNADNVLGKLVELLEKQQSAKVAEE